MGRTGLIKKIVQKFLVVLSSWQNHLRKLWYAVGSSFSVRCWYLDEPPTRPFGSIRNIRRERFDGMVLWTSLYSTDGGWKATVKVMGVRRWQKNVLIRNQNIKTSWMLLLSIVFWKWNCRCTMRNVTAKFILRWKVGWRPQELYCSGSSSLYLWSVSWITILNSIPKKLGMA